MIIYGEEIDQIDFAKKEYEKVISDLLGFEPVAIDSALKSAQKRYRLYWFGVRDGDTYKAMPIQQPKDEGLVLKDIIEDGFVDKDKSYCIDANYWKGGNLKMYFEMYFFFASFF